MILQVIDIQPSIVIASAYHGCLWIEWLLGSIQHMSLPEVPTPVLHRPHTCDMGDGDDQTQGSG